MLKSSPSPISPCWGLPLLPAPVSKSGFPSSLPQFPRSAVRRNVSSSIKSRPENADNHDGEEKPFTGFSLLSSDIPWDGGSIWNIMGGYFFCFHIPLSFGVLPAIAQSPQSKTVALIFLQTLELVAALLLLNYSRNEKLDFSVFFQDSAKKGRSWAKAAILGSGFLITLVLLTSLIADRLLGSKEVNNEELKEMIEYYPESGAGFFLIYCVVTPALEEAVYRGFLLTSLAKEMEWERAVAVSAAAFAAAHLSPENFGQLFVIGCVLGSVYSWCGNLAASFAVHSCYNATILFMEYFT